MTTSTQRTAIVTGAARGIGLEICRPFKETGWRVIGVDRLFASPAHDDAFDERFDVDVTDFPAVAALIASVESRTGAVGALVNNAGITRDGFGHKMSPVDFMDVIAVNLGGAFNLSRAVLPSMRTAGFGRIVNISSMNALKGQIGQSNYAASKAGIVGMTKSLALENASRGITVNAIAPGFVASDMTDRIAPEERSRQISLIPAGRPGQPRDIAAAVGFLVSDGASFVTGQVLSVNGGQLMP